MQLVGVVCLIASVWTDNSTCVPNNVEAVMNSSLKTNSNIRYQQSFSTQQLNPNANICAMRPWLSEVACKTSKKKYQQDQTKTKMCLPSLSSKLYKTMSRYHHYRNYASWLWASNLPPATIHRVLDIYSKAIFKISSNKWIMVYYFVVMYSLIVVMN